MNISEVFYLIAKGNWLGKSAIHREKQTASSWSAVLKLICKAKLWISKKTRLPTFLLRTIWYAARQVGPPPYDTWPR